MSDKKQNRCLPNYADQMRLLQAERPKVLWHWRHRPYEDLKLRRKKDEYYNSNTDKAIHSKIG